PADIQTLLLSAELRRRDCPDVQAPLAAGPVRGEVEPGAVAAQTWGLVAARRIRAVERGQGLRLRPGLAGQAAAVQSPARLLVVLHAGRSLQVHGLAVRSQRRVVEVQRQIDLLRLAEL